MKKLIETFQENIIECDNVNCKFVIPATNKDGTDKLEMYINVACPLCYHTLLTFEDYTLSMKVRKRINFINKWFSWLRIFNFRNKSVTKTIKIHK
jgi:hypothetical protein